MKHSIVILVLMSVILPGCARERELPAPVRSENGNIIVYYPRAGDVIGSPVTVYGKARVFEAALSVRILTEDEQELALEHTTATAGGPEFGDFFMDVSFTVPPGVERGAVEAFSYSAKDGRPINIARVPVRFR